MKNNLEMTDELVESFFNKFPIPKGCAKEPYVIVFDAYSGMGKSTVSRELTKYIDAVILNNDEVRCFLNDLNDTTDLKNRLQRMRLESLLKNHNNCILDNCFSHQYERKLQILKDLKCRYFTVRLECDEAIIKERMDKRTIDGINFSGADYQHHLRMIKTIKRVPDELIDYTIYTDQELDEQIKALVNYIEHTK